MLTGCTEDDYTVVIGNAICTNVHVITNHLQCQPPFDQPGQPPDGHVIAGAVQVVVSKLLIISRGHYQGYLVY